MSVPARAFSITVLLSLAARCMAVHEITARPAESGCCALYNFAFLLQASSSQGLSLAAQGKAGPLSAGAYKEHPGYTLALHGVMGHLPNGGVASCAQPASELLPDLQLVAGVDWGGLQGLQGRKARSN